MLIIFYIILFIYFNFFFQNSGGKEVSPLKIAIVMTTKAVM